MYSGEELVPWKAEPTVFNFKKGDLVRILRQAKNHENGWNNAWTREMDKAVGRIGAVLHVIQNDKDVQLRVPGVTTNFGYPAFVLELTNEFVENEATAKNRLPVVGDRVEIPASLNSVWVGRGVVTKVYDHSPIINVKMETGTETGREGGFDRNKVILVKEVQPIMPIVPATKPVEPAPVVSLQQKSALQTARNLAVSLAKQNPARTVTIDWVQDELAKLGFTSSDLGNAAGIVFKGNQFKNTGMTAKSVRPGNNHRRITVWQYVGNNDAPAISTPYVVQVSRNKGVTWERSFNSSSIDKKNLSQVTFLTFEAANKEARHQQVQNPYYLYQAAPVIEPTSVTESVKPQQFIVETSHDSGKTWSRSGNTLSDGRRLSQTTFPTLEKAEAEAERHRSNQSGGNVHGRPYRATLLP